MHLSALILAAGKSTRLAELGRQKPKPLLPVLGRPLIEWNTMRIRAMFGIVDIRCNASHLSEQIVSIADRLKIPCSVEAEIQGTGGGIALMARTALAEHREKNIDAFLCHNGKVMSDINLDALADHHIKTNADVTLAVSRAGDTLGLPASIGVENNEHVRWIRHRKENTNCEAFVFTGIHMFSRDIVNAMPNGPHCLIDGTYLPLLNSGAKISAYIHPGYYHEHSDPARYLAGNMRLLDKLPQALASIAPQTAVPFPNTANAWITTASQYDRTDKRASSPSSNEQNDHSLHLNSLHNVVLGRNVRISPGCTLKNSVVWDNMSITQSLSDCVVTPQGIISCDRPTSSIPQASDINLNETSR